MDRPTFVQHLRRSRLLPDDVIDTSLATLPELDSRALADRLVEERRLTKYQASQLLQGKSRGFLLGPYRIVDQLGQGGMGTVFKAVHATMDRVVAIKVLQSRPEHDEHDLQMFQREVRAAAQLHHPNIVTAYDANEIKGVYYLVMEFVDGMNLERLVRRHRPLPVALVVRLLRQSAEALAHAHSKGMVHRDIKPANLLVAGLRKGEDGLQRPQVKILDFGLARMHPGEGVEAPAMATIAVKAGAVFGTPDYISPEQAQDVHKVDNRSDLYSLGCTFYFALAGKPPFTGENSLEKLVKHLTVEPEPLERYRADVPPVLSAIIRKCMAKDPADRYASADELLDALAPFGPPPSTPAIQIDTLASASTKTPAGSDAEIGTGWTFDAIEPRGPATPRTPPAAGRWGRMLHWLRAHQRLVAYAVAANALLTGLLTTLLILQ